VEGTLVHISIPHRSAVALLLVLVASTFGSAGRAEDKKSDDKKPTIVLPKDPKAVVITYDPGAGGFIRKGEAPYLKIQADGQVTVTGLHDGTKKESKLSAKELDELLRFVIQDKEFATITAAKIDAGIKDAAGKGPFIAIGGAGTSVIMVENDGKKHEVSYRGASAYLRTYPKVDVLARFVAVEKRLADLGATVAKGK
jgi:hypothetical protein